MTEPRKIITNFWSKPIPPRQFDWEAYFDGDEPDDNGNMKCGYGLTEDAAVADLLEDMSPADIQWHQEMVSNHWTLPAPSFWLLRLWGIRHVIACFLAWRVDRHDNVWRSLGLIPTGYDNWCLHAKWRGWW